MNVQSKDFSERTLLEKTAERYRAKGYKVAIEPAAKERPDFLSDFLPDLIATKGDEGVVVELKTPYPRDADARMSEIAGRVRQQPGWRFDLVIGGSAEAAKGDLPSARVLRSRLKEAAELLEARHVVAGALLLWATFEGAARRAAMEEGIEIDTSAAGRILLRELVAKGLLEDEDYETSGLALERRNGLAHGYSPAAGDARLFLKLRPIAENLLRSSAKSAK